MRLATDRGPGRLATLDHVLGCTWCRSELDLLRASADAASTVVRETAGVSRGVRGIPVRTLAMAAGIVVVIGVGLIAREREGIGNERGVLRGNAPSVVLATPERRADGAVLLRWSSLSDATRYRIELFDVGHTFLPGHRIRLEVSSSAYPAVAPNANTGHPVATDTESRVARQQVHHGSGAASHIDLPVMPDPN